MENKKCHRLRASPEEKSISTRVSMSHILPSCSSLSVFLSIISIALSQNLSLAREHTTLSQSSKSFHGHKIAVDFARRAFLWCFRRFCFDMTPMMGWHRLRYFFYLHIAFFCPAGYANLILIRLLARDRTKEILTAVNRSLRPLISCEREEFEFGWLDTKMHSCHEQMATSNA